MKQTCTQMWVQVDGSLRSPADGGSSCYLTLDLRSGLILQEFKVILESGFEIPGFVPD